MLSNVRKFGDRSENTMISTTRRTERQQALDGVGADERPRSGEARR